MRVWIDMTAPAHVLVFRPLIELLREQGAEIELTARDYAQTLQLLELHGMGAEVVGHHGARSPRGCETSAAGPRGAGSTWRWRTARTS
jgi:predicted glycosyltransferase